MKINSVILLIVYILLGLLNTVCQAENTPVPSWLGPIAIEFLNDDTLLVMQQDAKRLDWFSLSQKKILDSVSLSEEPHVLLLDKSNPDSYRAFIAAGWNNGCVYQIDLNNKSVTTIVSGIHSPWAMAISKKTQKLYVGRRFHNDVVVVDLQSGTQLETTIPVIREPTTMVISPHEKTLYVGNALLTGSALESIVSTKISQIDLETNAIEQIDLIDGANVIRGMTLSRNGEWLVLVHNLSSHRTITSQLAGGWTSENAVTFYNTKTRGAAATYVLDDTIIGTPNPWSVQFSPDNKLMAITIAGSRQVMFFSVEKMFKQVNRDTQNMSLRQPIYYDTGSINLVINALVRVEKIIGPRALAMNDKHTVVAGYFSDNLAVFDRIDNQTTPIDSPAKDYTSLAPELITLGPAPVLNAVRRGEILFHDGEASLESWHSCATCHPDARVDGFNWDLLNDGTGNHKSTKSMLLAHKTPPCMALGVRADAETAVAAGFVHIHFIPRPKSDYQDVDEYLKALVPVPGPAINPDGTLSESAKRGKRLFHSVKTGCSSCHFGPYLTDQKMHDVGTESDSDFGECEFDTPSLIELHRTAPYLHDGRYSTLQDLLFKGLHGDLKGERLPQLSDKEKEDLINYLLSL